VPATGSGLTGLLPARYARHFAALAGAHVFDIPAELPPLPIAQAWHVRHDLDPAHRWLRSQVAAVFRAGEPPAGTSVT
jgi:DNA-binding transcriptional LysR family regulator